MVVHSRFLVQVFVQEYLYLSPDDDLDEPNDIVMCDVFDIDCNLSTYEEARALAERVAKTGKGLTAPGM